MSYKESENLELKSSFSDWKKIIISLSAFTNKKGGKVIIGLDDNGKSTNLIVGKSTIEDFVNKIKNNTDPILYPSINVKTFGLGEIVVIEIPESDQKPVFAFDRAYMRVGKTNIKLATSEVRKMIKAYTLPDFDELIVENIIKINDLDSNLIALLNKNYYKYQETSVEDILKKLELFKKGKITNSGYLCFTKKNNLLPSAIVKAARFKGNSMSKFIDMKDFDTNLIVIVDEVLGFIRRHTNMEVSISGKPQRNEQWDYPMDALREAIINGIVHRDYSDSGNIQIRIFDDSLEIWSPGLLPKEIDIKKLLKGNRSILRNKSIAKVFYKIKLIENWGTGFNRIVEACNKNGNPIPDFEEKVGAFVITFKKNNSKKAANVGANVGVNVGVNVGINVGVNKVLSYIKEHQPISAKKISEYFDNVTQRTIERWIKQLKEDEKIEFKGSPRTGGYYVR